MGPVNQPVRAWVRLVALVTLLVGGLATAPTVAAADPAFGEATATARFGEGIDVEQPVTLTEAAVRVEAVVRVAGSARTFLATIPTPAVGSSTLRYHHETPPGALYPNTRVQLGFRVTHQDGRIVDGPTTTVRYEDDRFAWQTLEGPLVRVHWVQGNDEFGRRALDVGERAVEEGTRLLGVQETEPIDFFVYGDRESFYDILGPAQRENVGGIALPEIRTLFANIPPSEVDDPWVGIVIPHELTHLVFGTATGNPYHEPPHWLNEGLADYLAQGYGSGARAAVEGAARSGELMPLRALVARFPTTPQKFSLAYDESVSAIDYLIRAHGQDALVSLIRSYAEGVSDDDAFRAALGVDVATFESGWLEDLGMDEPPAFGPLPAPPGPLPPGWAEAPAPTPGPSGGPVATPAPTTPSGSGDLVGPVVIGVLAVLAVLLVAGLIVVARGLSRGDPLLPPPTAPEPQNPGAGRGYDPGVVEDPDRAYPDQPKRAAWAGPESRPDLRQPSDPTDQQ
jgi:Peptidase MA superfamily